MNWLFKLNNFFRIWGTTFRAMGKLKIWLPLLVLLILQLLLLFQLVRFYQPHVSWLMVPIFKLIASERALHYPQFYLALPYLYNLFSLVLIGFFSIFANAVVIWLLSSHFLGKTISLKEAWRNTKSRFGHLFLIWVFNTLAAALVLILPGVIFSDWMSGSPRRTFFLQAASFGAGVLVSGFFAYCYNAILLSGDSWLKSLTTNFQIFQRNFFSTCFFIAVPGLLSWGYGILTSNTPLIISKFRPDIVPALLVIGSLINTLVVLWILGSLARLFLYEVKEVPL
jgi:hypothetical protein